MTKQKEISSAVIARLPRYYRYLGDLRDNGVERISSLELSRMMNVTASQIRQDFNHFGGFGQQGYGYNTEYLYAEIGKILGLDHKHNMILVGAGNLGSALIKYMNFRNRGFYFKAAFDINEALYDRQIAGIDVYPMELMASYIRDNSIDIAVLTNCRRVISRLTGREHPFITEGILTIRIYILGIKGHREVVYQLDIHSHTRIR